MPRISLLSISLAAKCRLLFGLAVLLIISATLFIPWLRMRDLVHSANIQLVRQVARLAAARSDLQSGNWDAKQAALRRWWGEGATRLGFRTPVPRLIQLADPTSPKPPRTIEFDAYLSAALETLAANPAMTEYEPTVDKIESELIYRIVLPIRSTGGKYAQGTLLGIVAAEYPAPRARFDLWTNLGLSLMAGALGGILAVLVFYLITHKLILSPVRELTRVAENVSTGEHSVRSQIATGDEYEELARAFNAMLAHLEASEIELRTINRSLDARLVDLAERNVALFESNKLKSQFLANVSHELRTPLTSIIGFAELLREASAGEGGRVLRYSENIMSSGRMLLGIINDLLDLAKIEAGKMELHVAPIDLAEMFSNLIDFMRPLAEQKNLRLTANLAAEAPRITSDSVRLQQILYNLLSNAIKFTGEGGMVELSLRQSDENRVRIAVTDTGVGIPQSELPRVFEKFHQIDGSMTREHSGTGLGLAITKELVTILGGTIHVTSEVGQGSQFIVLLPIVCPQQPTESGFVEPPIQGVVVGAGSE